MSGFIYYQIMRQSKDKRILRYHIVMYAKEHGNKPAARAFNTTVKTVRKWVRRWSGCLDSLRDESRVPKYPQVSITKRQRDKVIALKKRLPHWGALRIKREFGLNLSDKAIRKIWKKEGLLRKRRRKYVTKNNLRAIKASWPLFSQIEIDTKHLYDIPEYWIYMQKLGLPKYQYTAREVNSGLQFMGFSHECCLAYSKLFVSMVISHLVSCGVNLEGFVIQTDNGSEFIGGWNAKKDSSFTKVIEDARMIHKTIWIRCMKICLN